MYLRCLYCGYYSYVGFYTAHAAGTRSSSAVSSAHAASFRSTLTISTAILSILTVRNSSDTLTILYVESMCENLVTFLYCAGYSPVGAGTDVMGFAGLELRIPVVTMGATGSR